MSVGSTEITHVALKSAEKKSKVYLTSKGEGASKVICTGLLIQTNTTIYIHDLNDFFFCDCNHFKLTEQLFTIVYVVVTGRWQ